MILFGVGVGRGSWTGGGGAASGVVVSGNETEAGDVVHYGMFCCLRFHTIYMDQFSLSIGHALDGELNWRFLFRKCIRTIIMI